MANRRPRRSMGRRGRLPGSVAQAFQPVQAQAEACGYQVCYGHG